MVDHRLPQRLAEPPLGLVAAHVEELSGIGVHKVVVDDSVVSRIKPRDDGIVVGESEGRENGDQAGLGLGPVFNEPVDVASWSLELIAEAEAVGGDEDDDRVGEFGEGAGFGVE